MNLRYLLQISKDIYLGELHSFTDFEIRLDEEEKNVFPFSALLISASSAAD